MRIPIFFSLMAVVVAACPGAEPDCTRDLDCAAGFVCRDDRCVIGDVGEGEGEGEIAEGEGEGEGEEGEGESDQVCDANSQVCDNDRLCVGGFCDKSGDGDGIPPIDDLLGCCLRILCLGDGDCDVDQGERCDVNLGVCSAPLACDPDAQVGENGCGETELCVIDDNGVAACGPPPAAAACRLWPGRLTVVENPQRPVRFDVTTLDDAGRALPHIDSDVVWSADGGAAEPRGIWTAPACDAAACDFVVTAAVSGASCSASVRVLDAIGAGVTRAVVVDRISGAPLANVSVVAMKGGALTTASSDAGGVAVLAVDAPDALSAFPDDDHAWLTVMAPPADALLALDVDLVGVAAGAKGTVDFSRVSTFGDISAAFVGVALADLTSFSRGRFFGFTSQVNIQIDGVTDPGGQLVPLSSGTVLMLGETPMKGDFVALGEPGIGALWAFGSRQPLAEVGPIISGVAAGGGDATNSLTNFLQLAPPVDAIVVTGLAFEATDAPATSPDAEAPPFDAWDLPEVQPSLGVFVHSAVDVAALDLAGFPGALVVAAGVLPGAGFVPLGAGIAADVPLFDEGQAPDGFSDPFVLRSAPLHAGLEGSADRNVVIAAAFDTNDATSMERAVSVSRASVGATLPPFLPVPTGTFSPGQALVHDDGGVGGVDPERFFRVVFDNGAGRTWSVWFATPGTAVDVSALHPDDAEAAARSNGARIESFAIGGGVVVAPASYTEMFALDGPGGRVRFLDAIAAAASLRCDGAGECAP